MHRYTTYLIMALFFPIACWANVSLPTSAKDALITTAIKAQYAKNSLFSASDVHVTTDNGRVKLQGLLDAKLQAKRAIELAKETQNVQAVDAEDLKVRISQQPEKDKQLTAQIIAKLEENKVFGRKEAGIVVEVENGVAYIDGYVSSMSERAQINTIAKSVSGVQRVKEDMRMIGLRT